METQELEALQTVYDILALLFKPLSDSKYLQGQEMICVDGNVQLCFPKLFCWLPDYMEAATIHCISSNRCPICVSPTKQLVEYPETGYPTRSHEDYAIAYKQSDVAILEGNGVKNVENALWLILYLNPPDIVRADILHNILLGVLKHLIEWIQAFLEQHDRINAFDHVWRRLSSYTGFSVPTKAYHLVSQ